MSFWAKSGLKWPILGQIIVIFQIFTLVTCLRYCPIITQNFRKIFRADSGNRANEVFRPKMVQKRPSLVQRFFYTNIGLPLFSKYNDVTLCTLSKKIFKKLFTDIDTEI